LVDEQRISTVFFKIDFKTGEIRPTLIISYFGKVSGYNQPLSKNVFELRPRGPKLAANR